MTYCGWDEIAAAVDIELGSPGLDVQGVLDEIWDLQRRWPSVLVHSVGASFGPVDITVMLKTKLDRDQDGNHPTWRIAGFVQDLHNVEHVRRTQTRIIVHDPHHDAREGAEVANQKKYDGYWSKKSDTKPRRQAR